MKIAVFDYIEGSVDIIETDIKPNPDFDCELWLEEQGYNLSSCSWMVDIKQITFKEAKDDCA